MYSLDDTIAAIASPPGGAARGIVRISGPQAIDCLERLFRAVPISESGAGVASPPPRPGRASCDDTRSGETELDRGRALRSLQSPHAVVGELRMAELHSPLPCEAYVWPDGRSYTGQPVVEIHTLGSPPLLQLVLRSVCAAGARLAGPGEFTLRAFLAGRIDLTQAEAVLGVIDADDPHALNVALAQLAGGLARPLSRLRDTLVDLLAHVEAGFDFADEDLAFITHEDLDRQLAAACRQLAGVRRQVAARGEATDAICAVLVGRPNTGKSSLFNVLSGNRAALVSDHPGTTRDYLTADIDLDGVKCRLVDTAGTGDERPAAGDARRATVDQTAHSLATEQRRAAQVQVLCLDATRTLDAWERSELAGNGDQRIIVLTKCDARRQTDCQQFAMETSSVTGQGIAALRGELRRRTLAAGENRGDVVAGTAARCAESLRLAARALRRARRVATARQEDLAAAEMRAALEELDKVVGAVYTEDVLDRIFSRFCVGK
jgi:tRNA modification GTPase